MYKKALKSFIPTFLLIFLIISIILMPKTALLGAKSGLLTWFNIVFPSLFPFIVATDLLCSFQVVKFLGALIEPIMKPIFNIRGIGALAWIIGVLSGYPVGAKITADLRANGELNKAEAQRLISFSNNASPLFILSTVGLGMFNSEAFGYTVLICHVLASFIVGIIFRFYHFKERNTDMKATKGLFKKAVKAQQNARSLDKRKASGIFSDSIINSMNIVLQIGGFIIFFSVITMVLSKTGILSLICTLILEVSSFFGITLDFSAANGIAVGLIEYTNGLSILSSSQIPLIQKAVIASFLLSFSGISILAQSIGIISKTDINTVLYVFSKFLTAIISSVLVVFLFPKYSRQPLQALPAFSTIRSFSEISLAFSLFMFLGLLYMLISINITKLIKK